MTKRKRMRLERFDVLKDIYTLVTEDINISTTISEIQKRVREKDYDKEKTAISMLVSLLKKEKCIIAGDSRGSYKITQKGIDLIEDKGYYK